MSSTGSSLKRSRETPNHDDPPPWECTSFYGIVHPSGCNTCRTYMSHISEAKASSKSSIHRAFKDLDKDLDTFFFDGVAEGRRRQRADDQDRLRNLERSRSSIRSGSYETGQLALVKSQLRLAQSECDALKKRIESLTNQRHDDLPDDTVEVERMLVDDTHDVPERTPSPSRVPTLSNVLPPHSPGAQNLPELYTTNEHSAIPLPKPGTPSRVLPIMTLPPRPTVEVIASSGALDFRPSTSFSSNQSIGAPKTLRQLQHLMNRAHQPGNGEALAKVKALCAEAHATPREEKTDLQTYVLANWRNPPVPPPTSVSPSPAPQLLPESPRANNPRIDDPVEVWHAYLTMHRGSWPRGVRREVDGSPHMSDLKASRAVARLRPEIADNGDTTLRTEFMACAVQLFASPGMYQDLLRRESLSVAPVVSYKPYHATKFSVTAAEVARHFAAAGVSVEDAVTEFEPWAQQYQSVVVFPAGSESRHSKPTNNYSPIKSSAYRPRQRQFDSQDRFGWR
ncbi:hypothetical protein C8R45DRAFT_1068726 [Mycena sanguinolenta]|nr:hypothetical protein C8R45DRAFT_1068726 [Mycena sanguinolenta]